MLRGVGAAIALLLLDGMVPAFAAIRNTVAKPVRRLVVVCAANGMAMKYWRPETVGPLELTPILLRSSRFGTALPVVSGLDSKEADARHFDGSDRRKGVW